MSFSGISIPQLLIILAIILLVFGSKKIGTLGSDLGAALKGFRKAIAPNEEEDEQNLTKDQESQTETKQ